MMACKARIFRDEEVYRKIKASEDPKEIKSLGRTIKNFDPKTWDDIKMSVVVNGNFYKFNQNKELGKLLFSTGDRVLVEASPYDRIWGVGLAEDNPLILDEANWLGKNLLGKCLMEVRYLLND